MIKLKSLLHESALKAAIAEVIAPEDRVNNVFMSGVYKALQDKKYGTKTKLRGLPDDFVRGYKSIGQEGMLSKLNHWVTDKLGQMGSSLDHRIWKE